MATAAHGDTVAGRIAVLICYDAEFPEWVRIAAAARDKTIGPRNDAFADRRPHLYGT